MGVVMTVDVGGDGVASAAPVVWFCWAETGPAVHTTTAKMRIAANEPLFMGQTLTYQPHIINSEVLRHLIPAKRVVEDAQTDPASVRPYPVALSSRPGPKSKGAGWQPSTGAYTSV